MAVHLLNVRYLVSNVLGVQKQTLGPGHIIAKVQSESL